MGNIGIQNLDKVANSGKRLVDWGKTQEDNQAAKFGAIDPRIIGFTSDITGGFGRKMVHGC